MSQEMTGSCRRCSSQEELKEFLRRGPAVKIVPAGQREEDTGDQLTSGSSTVPANA